MEHYIVARNSESLFPYHGWPTVARDAKGVLYAAVSAHRLGHVCPFGKNYLYISKDEGKTWSVPLVVNDTAHDDRDGGLCAWGDGNLLLTWFHNTKQLYRDRAAIAMEAPHNSAAASPVAQAVFDMWDELPAERMQEQCAFIRRSHDGGMTWDTPTAVNFTAPHGPTRTADGRLLYAGTTWDAAGKRSICFMVSADDGISWTKLADVPPLPDADAADPCEPHSLLLPNGVILMVIRSYSSESKHLMLYITRSFDGGRTFDIPQRMKDQCGAPGHLMLHSSGAVILSYSVRSSKDKPLGSYARVSYDNGDSWSDEFMIGRPSPVWDHGYPSTVELSDGSLYTVYYQRAYDTDEFCSLLGCRWTLPPR